MHPDIVGVYYPFDDYKSSIISLISTMQETACKLFSFEMKISIDYSNLRECFFQAVSNSSWANEGYLVALKYDSDPTLIDEMRRLNNSFGIGFIQLNADNIEQSEILFTSKLHETLDWETINRLAEDNLDFESFIKSVVKDIMVSEVRGDYDEVYEDEKYQSFVVEKGLSAF